MRNNRERRLRFSIRKFNIGVASVAVAAFWMISGATVAANDQVSVSEATAVTENLSASEAVKADEALDKGQSFSEDSIESDVKVAGEVEEIPASEEGSTEAPSTNTTTTSAEEAPVETVKAAGALSGTQVATSQLTNSVTPATRTAATTYRVQYVDEVSGDVLKSQTYSINEQTTASVAERHTFHVSIVLDSPTGYKPVEAQNDAGHALTIVDNVLAAAVIEKESASRNLRVTIRKEDSIVSGTSETDGYATFRVLPGSTFKTKEGDTASDKNWEIIEQPKNGSTTEAEAQASVEQLTILQTLYNSRGTALMTTSGFEFTDRPGYSTTHVIWLGDSLDGDLTDDYNERNNKELYVRYNVKSDLTDLKTVIAELVDRRTNTVLETQTIREGDTNVSFQSLDNFASQDNGQITFKFFFTSGEVTIRPYEADSGNESGSFNNISTVIYDEKMSPFSVTGGGIGVVAPGTSKQVTNYKLVDLATYRAYLQNPGQTYLSMETGEEKLLAKYTQEGLAGHYFSIPAALDFEKYELVETPKVNGVEEGVLSKAVTVGRTGTQTVNVVTITDTLNKRGDYQMSVWVLDPSKPGYETQYGKTPEDLSDESLSTYYTRIYLGDPVVAGERTTTPGRYDFRPDQITHGRTLRETPEHIYSGFATTVDRPELGLPHGFFFVPLIAGVSRGENGTAERGRIGATYSGVYANTVAYVSEQNYFYVEKGSVIVRYYAVDKTGQIIEAIEGTVAGDSRVMDSNGALKTSVSHQEMDTDHGTTGESYTTTDLRPDIIKTSDGRTFKRIDLDGTNPKAQNGGYTDGVLGLLGKEDQANGIVSGRETGDTLQATETKLINYYYEEIVANPIVEEPKIGNVVINYVDLAGNVIADPKQDLTNQPVATTYNTTEDGEKPAVLTADQTRDGKVYFLTEKTAMTDGSAIAEGVKQTESTEGTGADTVKHTATTSGDTAKVVEGTTHVTYVYEQAGDVKVNYFKVDDKDQPTTNTLSGTTTGIAKTSVTATEVDTVLGSPESKPGTQYDTTDLRPATINDGTDTWELVAKLNNTVGDNENGTVEAGTTKVVNYYYRKVVTPPPAETKGSVEINYVDTDGNTLKSTVKDVTDVAVGSKYDTKENDNEWPEELAKNGKVYKRVEAGDYNVGTVGEDGNLIEKKDPASTHGTEAPTGDVTVEKKVITYVYKEVTPEAPKTGDVVVRYHIVDAEGNVIQRDAQTEVKDTVKANDGTSYTTTDYKPASIVVGNKTYDLVTPSTSKHAVTDGVLSPSDDTATHVSGTETGDTVAAEKTKVVNYYYVERQPEAPKPTGNVVITYVDTNGKELKTEVKDTTNGEVGKTYDTKEGNTEYPTYITTEDGKTYKRVPAGDYPVGKTTEDGHLTTSDKSSGTVEEGTKTVTYVYEEVLAPTPDPVGNVVIRYHIVDAEGNVVKENAQTEVKDTVDAAADTAYNTTDYKPASIVVDGKTYDLVTPETSKHAVTDGDAEDGAVVANETKVVNYYYVERQAEAPKPTGNVVITYVDTNGKELKTEVKDTTNGEVGKTYDTKEGNTEYPTYITTEDGKTYKRVSAGDYPVGKTTEDGHLTTSDKPSGTVEEGTKTVTYVYEEVLAPTPDPVGNVVVRYHIVDAEGNVVKENAQTEVKDTVDAAADTAYNTTDYKPASIVVDGKTYDLVTPETSKHAVTDGDAEDGAVVANETKVVNYYYVERQPEAPKPTGNVVITYVDTNGKELKTEVKDTTNGEVGKTYDTKEGNTEYPTYITTEDGKTYKRVPAGDYPVGKTTEDGHLTTSDKPSGTVEEGTKTVTYVYEEVLAPTPDPVGNVVVRYHIVDAEGNVVKENAQTEVKDTVDAAADTAYNTTDYKPASIVVDGKTYDLVTPETSKHAVTDGDAEDGAVVANETKVVNYYYVERQAEAPKPTGNVVITYVDTNGKELKTEVKDTTNGEVGKTYDTKEGNTEYPTYITTEDGKTYKRVSAGDYPVGKTTEDGHLTTSDKPSGTVEEGTKTVTYVYEEVVAPTPDPVGNVVVRYHIVDAEGNVVKENAQTEVKDTVDAAADTAYNTTDYKPASIVVDGKTYDLVTPETSKHAVTDGDAEDGAVVANETKVVNYYYVERQAEAPKPTGNVVITYVDTNGKELKTEVKDTTNGEVGKTYDTKEGSTEYPTYITTEDGKTYKRVPAGDYPVGKTTEDGHLTTSDKPSGTVEEGTKTVTYVYEEVVAPTPDPVGNVVVRYHIVDAEGNVVKENAQTEVKDTVDAAADTAYNTTDYKPASIVVDGKTYDLVTPETSKHAVTDGDAEDGAVVANETKVVNYYYVERQAEAPKPTGNVVITYVDTNGKELKTEVKDTTNGEVAKTYDTKEGNTEYPTYITTEDGKTYKRVPAGDYPVGKTTEDGHLTTSDKPGGTVEEGTKTVTYVYEEVVAPTPDPVGNVVVRYHIVDAEGNVVKENAQTEVKDTVDAAADTAYNTTDYKPASIVVDGKTYDLVTPETSKHAVTDGDAEDGAVVANETKVVNYYYVERQAEAPKPTGNVVITYVDTNGKELKTEVKDTTNGEVGKTYDTKEGNTEYPTYITTEDGKTYKRVPAGDYPVGKTTEDGHLTTSDTPTGTVEEGTKTVTYVYEEVVAPTPVPVGNVVVRYHIVDAEGNVVKENAQTEVKDTVDAAADTAYNTTDYKPASIVVDGKTYDLVTPETSKHAVTDGDAEDGAVVANETKVVNYYYVERQPEAPKPTGNVVITYVDTNGKELKTEVKDTTNGEVGKTYDTKEGTTEYPTYITTEDGKTYKRVPAGDYPVGKTTEDGHLTTSDKPSGTVEEGTKTVTYVYEEVKPTTPETPETPKTGNVVINYVDTEGNTLKSTVKDTTDGAINSDYDTKQDDNEYPEYITKEVEGVIKTYKRVPAGDYTVGTVGTAGELTSDNPADATVHGTDTPTGKVAEGTKTITYVYKEVTPEPVGNVVVRYHIVDAEGNVVKENAQTEVKDTVNAAADTAYNTTDYKPATITVDGKTYDLVTPETSKHAVTDGDAEDGAVVANETKVVNYYYVERQPVTPKTGNVVITYVDTNGKELKTEVKDTTNGEVGKTYDTKEGNTEYPTYITTEDGKTYKRVPAGDYPVGKTTEDGHLTTSDKPGGTVEEGTKTVTYVYEEVKPTTPETPETPKTGNVVITYVDTNGKELKTEVKDTTNGEVGKTYDTKEGTTEYPTYITTEDGKTYKRVPAGDYPVGKTTEDGHLTTSDKPSGTVEEGTKTVTYVYEEVVAPTPDPVGNVVVRYHIVDAEGNVVKENAQTEVKDTVNAAADTAYNTTDYKPATITVDGKTYDLVTPETSKHAVTDGDAEDGAVVANETKVVNYYYVERQPVTPKTGNVVITYVDTNGKELKTEVKDTTNGEVGKTYDTKGGNTEYPTYITTEDGKTYKRVPAGDYPVGKTTEDGHLTTSDKPGGTVEEGTKTVTYVYEEVVAPTPDPVIEQGNVEVHYHIVDKDGNVLMTDAIAPVVKSPSDADTPYSTRADKLSEITVGGKTYVLVTEETSKHPVTDGDAEDGSIVANATKIVNYYYVEKVVPAVPSEETPSKPGSPDKEIPSKPVSPRPEAVVQPVEPVTPRPVTPGTPAKATLPNTGDASSAASLLGAGILLTTASLFSRRRKED